MDDKMLEKTSGEFRVKGESCNSGYWQTEKVDDGKLGRWKLKNWEDERAETEKAETDKAEAEGWAA